MALKVAVRTLKCAFSVKIQGCVFADGVALIGFSQHFKAFYLNLQQLAFFDSGPIYLQAKELFRY